MDLGEVEQWSRTAGVSGPQFLVVYEESLSLAVLRLIHTAHRERFQGPSAVKQDGEGTWRLVTGASHTAVSIPVTAPLPLDRLEAAGPPAQWTHDGWRTVNTAGEFLEALRHAWPQAESTFDRMSEDFTNSLANLILTRLLFLKRRLDAPMVEPACGGHNYYPFPALRSPVSLADAVECSHVTGETMRMPLVRLRQHHFVSVAHADEASCWQAWSGSEDTWLPGTIPVHPWQWGGSAILRGACDVGLVEPLGTGVVATPLASQRTCRVEATRHDVKLPIDVTLTAERRLLYPLNVRNAPMVSALVRSVHEASGDEAESAIGFQYDLASLLATDDVIGSHVAAIIRQPLSSSSGAAVVPALLLWSAPCLAKGLLDIGSGASAVDFFGRYCRLVMEEPVRWYARWGLAFEPHLQNSLIEIRNGRAVRMILRDLDATILDAARVPALLSKHGLQLDPRTWNAMAPTRDGARRLRHSLHYAHLGEVCTYLVRRHGADPAELARQVDVTWDCLLRDHSGATRHRIDELRHLSLPVKQLLALRMRRSMEMQWACS
ncbi:IucA/IucC family protein [Streptomyces sp. MB09-01]|uniref:IucA/IucC family protein n=1 Tax=Streptomyces sp. MB09-01 TaxID=3028666 RepID=UPI0029B50487|nr:IucA/IucC family protein [Streptomyces sp. MB09-01]MDX3537374.1 IucA/IucC family protein [Streptomyces sp. MB09-01]